MRDMATTTVEVRARVPFETKARMKVGLLLARLGLESLTMRVVSRLAFDTKVGNRPWKRMYVNAEWSATTRLMGSDLPPREPGTIALEDVDDA